MQIITLIVDLKLAFAIKFLFTARPVTHQDEWLTLKCPIVAYFYNDVHEPVCSSEIMLR